VRDADRIEEFLSHYGREPNPEHRIAIAALIVASLDDAFALEPPLQGVAGSRWTRSEELPGDA
jgi:hypothetical protein